ncbi:YheC/YheD family protein [Sporotomaculum syntrophicum]|uniref:YheC/YheD family endospore coat-associated protein n=1 Tax=Sporotomaculum syntrophicum TaxID=182264 RepID=UPI001FAE4B37|nr:YheC/YheD family protein [Sporotomaculum syntrophicum]
MLLLIIGMLHHRKDPQKVVKSYAFAAVAKAEGAELLYFTPKAVDFSQNVIHGYVYVNGVWEKKDSPFPEVVYNAGSPEKLAKSHNIIAKLKELIPFTTYSIGNKMRVYQRLKLEGKFAQYLIPSEVIHSTRRFFDLFNTYRKVVFKPVNGRKGQGITYIEGVRDRYNIRSCEGNCVLSFEELRDLVAQKLRDESHLLQPYINCKTKSGISYDVRLHVQKDGAGKWLITAIYPRFAPEGSIVSNINSGGSTNYLIPFLKQEFGDEYFNIKRYLEHFSLQLAAHMDEVQQKYFNERIDELGIDAGLDDLGKIWVYEVNWRPGCPPTFYLELDVVRNMIKYAMYLARERKDMYNNITGGTSIGVKPFRREVYA